ncbi:hypothetical protein NDR87_22080 [Nocardia sp. CDC159]|uniref:Uncharacterized protein n=1 Tax=Nocardia pulmonis TaxID=2951408 RepID=A0A9X2EEQ8_9NOCA|nr:MULTISPECIES: hypothetical protein [Nocardia]MCM6776791.1 hypothetical protein [Nocardia pulmonis]MCM6789060.1 hypothetical protein [Nocardia sp. CDC159]
MCARGDFAQRPFEPMGDGRPGDVLYGRAYITLQPIPQEFAIGDHHEDEPEPVTGHLG